jgi:adenylate cyclase
MSERGWRTSAWQGAAIAAAATAIVFAASRTTSFRDVGSWTYDFTVIHAGLSAASPDVVLVDFDEETFDRIAKYPIPRETIARVVSLVGAQKPRVIGMDVFLSEPRNAAEDKAMQDALTAAGVVVLASQESAGVLPPVTPMAQFCQPEEEGVASGFCKEGAPGALGYAFVNLPMDDDGFIRRGLLFSGGKTPAPSFPLMLAQQYSGQAIKPVDTSHASFNGHDLYYADPVVKSFLIGSWGRSPLTHIPAWKFLADEAPANAVTDKLVLMGQSNDAARDRHFTPLFRSADETGQRLRMAGTEIHGAAVRSLLEGTVVRTATPRLLWVSVALVCWLAALLMLQLRTEWGVLSALVLAVLAVGTALVLYARARFWMPFLPAELGVFVTLPLALGVQFVLEQIVSRQANAQRKQMMKLFSSYVDPAVANTIWERRDEVLLAGEERVATVMFSDIRSFTAMSAGKPPAEVLAWLNRYMSAMDEVIREHGGFLNKFIGDGLMIIFGLPLSRGVKEEAVQALRASVAMLERVEELNREGVGNPALPQLRIGIGLHTGSLMAGSIGSAARQEYSVIGETVNLASRLESLNKQFKTEILMSEATYDLVRQESAGFRALGLAKVAGLDEPVEVFTVAESVPQAAV